MQRNLPEKCCFVASLKNVKKKSYVCIFISDNINYNNIICLLKCVDCVEEEEWGTFILIGENFPTAFLHQSDNHLKRILKSFVKKTFEYYREMRFPFEMMMQVNSIGGCFINKKRLFQQNYMSSGHGKTMNVARHVLPSGGNTCNFLRSRIFFEL